MATDLRELIVYDRRSGNKPEVLLNISQCQNFEAFEGEVRKVFNIKLHEKFIICTTNREKITDDETFDQLDSEETLYLLRDIKQELSAPTQARIQFLPHYDTLVKSGMYEYYASSGQNPLPYALAELIDNALSATATNSGLRNIEIRLMLEDGDKCTVAVMDNGRGMTSRQLNNWAIYRLSKFTRKEKFIRTIGGHSLRHPRGQVTIGDLDDSEMESPVSCGPQKHLPRSLNSEISYFGVGGKQATFFIGNCTRMITKAKESCDVHELTISKEEFERKEKSKQAIYTGFIHNRQPGDTTHVNGEDENLLKVIQEERNKESFTYVVIQGILHEQFIFLKYNFRHICRQLAHIYHYYIHGPHGNMVNKAANRESAAFSNINIEVKFLVKGLNPKTVNMRDIEDDRQSQFIQSSESNFEFKAVVEGTGVVEGILRYHPFLYDRETYPAQNHEVKSLDYDDDHDYALDTRPARGRQPIFECFWNGRLIPYTTIDEFDWCSTPKKSKNIPLDCYNRVSGVLWTNDKFQVSTNKLTFMDLEVRLRDKNTIFCRVINGQEKRGNIDRQFTDWLKECHETCDKQIKFCSFHGIIMRPDLPRNKQHPWAVYYSIEWDGKMYKKGQLVRMQRTIPVIYGTIKKFLLFGDYDGEVFASGGDIEIVQEPKSLYNDVKVMPLTKLDRAATDSQIRKWLEEEEGKLPEKLLVSWPEGDELTANEKRPAGKTIGAIKVEIANRRGELISKLPGSSQKKLLIELKVVWHSSSGDQTIVNHICQHAKTWPYWFRKMDNIKNLGSHTLNLQAVVNESDASSYAGKDLPSHKIKFTVIEAGPEHFTVGLLDGPFRVGTPFQIPLEFQDKFGNSTKPNNKIKPELRASGLDLNYDGVQVKGNTLIIKGIIAKGTVETSAGKNFNLVVTIPGLEDDSQSLKIRLLPGPPNQLMVKPIDKVVEIENGAPLSFYVRIQDISGNCTAEPKLTVICKFIGSQGNFPVYNADLSATGQASLTGEILQLKGSKSTEMIKARIEVQGRRDIAGVEKTIKVLPSSRAAVMKLSYKNELGEKVTIEKDKELICLAGSSLQGLEFSILDEGGRPLDLIEAQLPKLKTSWVPNLSRDSVLLGHLPDIKIPLSIKETKYCNVSIGEDVDFSFTIKVKAGEPATIKCMCSGSNKIRLGELLQSDILVAISDKHGNGIKKLPLSALGSLEITGDNLVTDHMVRALGQSGGFVIKGISFEEGTLGPREICVRWRGLSDYIRLQMIAGVPMQITLPGYDVQEPCTVFNNTVLEKPLIVQLCDEAGNSCEDANIKIQLGIDEGLKLTPSPQAMKTDSQGRVSFGKLTVAVRSSHVYPNCPGNICGQNCRGIFSVCAKAFCGRNLITGPLLKFHIPSDPSKAVELRVEYDKNASYTVGETLSEFRVTVIAEDGNILDSLRPTEIRMKMWKAEGLQSKPPPKATTYSPSHRNKNSEVGVIIFKDRPIPDVAGTHNILFVYESGGLSLNSNLIAINVAPGRPVRLVPVQTVATPTISNTSKLASRTLIKSLKLELQDDHKNPAGFNIHGKLALTVTCETTVSEIPQLSGGNATVEVPLQKGQALIQNLTIEEDTPGLDGQEYILRCTVQVPDLPRNQSIPPYDIAFLFYNDVKKQAAMANLSRERDQLLDTIKSYKSLFETSQQELNELKMSAQVASQEEQKLKVDLRRQNIPAVQLNSLENVDNLIKLRMEEREKIHSTPRRQPGLAPGPRDPEVLGKIAHLAQLGSSDIAQVLSWHMSADMDCVVTHTLSKAREIYHKTRGTQQVLALDSIYRKNLPDWRKPLPHLKIKSNFHPTGNPVYARDLFIFPNDPENCKLVFGMLLGDTIILNTLDDATKYRQEIVKSTYCPTLLTRQGDRIRSNGKFGGQQNKAPPLDKLRGAIFGEPLPVHYDNLSSQIELLQSFHAAMTRHQQAQREYSDYGEKQQSPEMLEKMQECQEAEEKLNGLEERLGMSLSKFPTRVGPTRGTVTRGSPMGVAAEGSRTGTKRGWAAAQSSVRGSAEREKAEIPSIPGSSGSSLNGVSTRIRTGASSSASPSPMRSRRITEALARAEDRKRRKT